MSYLIRSFNFNGIDKPDWLYIKKSNRPMSPAQTAQLVKAPKKAGAYYFGKSTDPRPLAFEFLIMADNDLDLWKKAEWVTDWLDTDEPQALIINDEPDRIYYAVLVSGGDELEQLAAMGDSVLNFLCPDPFKYTQEYTQDLIANPTIFNDANADLFPQIEATFTADSTHFAIATEDRFLLIGEPEQVEKTTRPRLERVAYYGMNSLTGWSASGTRVDGGNVAGTMATDGTSFYPSAYGTSDGTGSGWHGPALKTSLTEPLDNWRMEAFITLNAAGAGQVGRIEIYMLDVNGNIIGKMAMVDRNISTEDNWGEALLGEASSRAIMINTHGNKAGVWNDFYGQLMLEKDGNKFTAFIGKYDTKKKIFHTRWTAYYYDKSGKYGADLAQIQVHIGQNKTYPAVATAKIDDLKVYRVNQLGETETNVIFKTGDELIIDNAAKMVYKNGAPYLNRLAFESQFLKLPPGSNPLAITPPGVATVTARYRKRFK